MKETVKAIGKLFKAFANADADKIEMLPQSGSDRIYFRIHAGAKTFIATFNLNVKENETFIYFSKHFRQCDLPVPEVFAVNGDKAIYIQQDFGSESLFSLLESNDHNDTVYKLYEQSLSELSRMQIIGDKGLDYEQCLTAKAFGRQAIMSDLLYFKYYFLDTLKMPYDKQAMLNDFERLSSYLTPPDPLKANPPSTLSSTPDNVKGEQSSNTGYEYFLFRDFQSRNIIVKDGKVYFIDYQGGMKGALQYDVASLLWQAKASLSNEWKERLLEYYIGETEKNLQKKIDRHSFINQYNGYVLIRLLQVLGAYGFRGLFERKAHFLTSIPLALRNLSFFLKHNKIDTGTPELDRMLQVVVSDETISRFEHVRADEQTPLVVKICSFSYKQGCPSDATENGGGFVFDMRGILNPGRYKEYKLLTGRDKGVQEFLEQRTKINEFLNSVFNIVDIAVEDYINRNFTSLMVSFGCTGGQHRSVYAADALVRHLKNKYGVKIQLCHVVQDAKGWINESEEKAVSLS